MTKKIRLMNEEGTDTLKKEIPATTSSIVNDLTVKQLMKYLEAIDWKLWEMLKLMKAEQDDDMEDEIKIDEDNLPG